MRLGKALATGVAQERPHGTDEEPRPGGEAGEVLGPEAPVAAEEPVPVAEEVPVAR
ncbi:hypothetical protein OHS59_33540 [Streptomyces sp. NBC_00414]|uniref:hypothetical protein n=1 Tax=Streptomyces sp. NBC_00414 TaxID=2975739 RepID=UPI002E1D457D